MLIDDIIALAKGIHDAEGWKLGTGSTRETRNQYWARVIGCAYHGHPIYNPGGGDPQWGLKKADAAAPQSDDVTAILTPSNGSAYMARDYWDCISGSGLNGYKFAASYGGQLPSGQIIYPPPVPQGTGPAPQPTPGCVFPPRNEGLDFFKALDAKYKGHGYDISTYYVDVEGTSVWYAEYLRQRTLGKPHTEAQVEVFKQIDAIWFPKP
jgi:hypothetical protein